MFGVAAEDSGLGGSCDLQLSAEMSDSVQRGTQSLVVRHCKAVQRPDRVAGECWPMHESESRRPGLCEPTDRRAGEPPLGAVEAPELGNEDGATPQEQSAGKPTTRRYSEQEKAAAVRMVRTSRAETDRRTNRLRIAGVEIDLSPKVDRCTALAPDQCFPRSSTALRPA